MAGVEERMTCLLSGQPCPPKYEEFFNKRGRELTVERIRVMATKLLAGSNPDKPMIPMAPGMPNTSLLPIARADIHLKDGTSIHLDEEQMKLATNIGASEGLASLRSWVEVLHKEENSPSFWSGGKHPEPFSLVITSGITEGMRCAIDILLDSDDTVLTETELFCTMFTMFKTQCHLETVEHDDQGMLVNSLEDILANWNRKYPHRKFPKLIYAITSGNNPTGYTWSQERLLDIYLLCRKYNLLIIEDAAYFYLQYGKRLPSFQTVDVDGRVLRMDTFSKIMGGGLRLGWVTGPDALVKKIGMAVQFTNMHPNHLAQVIVYSILQSWGYDGFRKHVQEVSDFYSRRAQLMCAAADKYLSDLCTWSVPEAGLFLWVRVKGITDSLPLVETLLQDKGVATMPGCVFAPSAETSDAIRLSYSVIKEEDIEKAFQILASTIKEHVAKLSF